MYRTDKYFGTIFKIYNLIDEDKLDLYTVDESIELLKIIKNIILDDLNPDKNKNNKEEKDYE